MLPRMIESYNLTKRYGGRTVVHDVSFRCEPGTVTGFVGPNGAGKTTTLRILCGLAEPDDGSSAVLGVGYRELPNPAAESGCCSMPPPSTAAAEVRGAGGLGREGVPTRRVDAMLDRVGLDRGAARKRVRQYSLGMRQRLGLAHALLGDPEVLILDEPANGLDPEGMRWMRELLRDFADRGGTVLLSSHLLREVQATVDRLVIIGDGRIVAQGTTKDLLSGVGTLVVADDESGLMAALAATDLAARTLPDGGFMVDAEPEAVGRAALDGGVALSHLGPSEGHDLEQLFFDLTAGSEALPAEPVEAAR